MGKNKLYTLGEEIFNSVTHGVGALLAIVGTTIMVVLAALYADWVAVVATAIFGGTLIIMYTMSTLYHAFTNEKVKKLFRIFDHCAIPLLIAGTYTPFMLIGLANTSGYLVFAGVWAMAIINIILNATNLEKFKWLSLASYVLMGWCIIVVLEPLVATIPAGALNLLIAGGVTYTLGIVFYLMTKLRYMHSIWHLFVLGGSVLHYLSVVLYILPMNY